MEPQMMVVTLPSHIYQRLQQRAERAGKTPEALTTELIESMLQQNTEEGDWQRDAVRQVLLAAGHLRLLSPKLRQRINPNVTLEEVRAALARAGGKPLSEIILEQRGPRP